MEFFIKIRLAILAVVMVTPVALIVQGREKLIVIIVQAKEVLIAIIVAGREVFLAIIAVDMVIRIAVIVPEMDSMLAAHAKVMVIYFVEFVPERVN
jgi:hypothetical protein